MNQQYQVIDPLILDSGLNYLIKMRTDTDFFSNLISTNHFRFASSNDPFLLWPTKLKDAKIIKADLLYQSTISIDQKTLTRARNCQQLIDLEILEPAPCSSPEDLYLSAKANFIASITSRPIQ